MNNKIYLQITSGRGPAECCRVVALVLEKILQQAKKLGLNTEIIEREQGIINRTLFSAVISIEGEKSREILTEWEGTIQWIAQSPYRIYHKRKNWFVGVKSFSSPDANNLNIKEISYQTLRASGPGGQHINKTESAVRATHIPSGLSVTASDQRSQIQNKKLATERLLIKLSAWEIEQAMQKAQENWNNHNNLQRGNPVKVIQLPLN
ncbi:peptide chain release factor H [Dysgonomonas macrotermitis]|uniref:Peptide chain release factor n=1 Tax=Dysgonomonas macrotermitis TaxID=1346286 RepID=A0A1M4WCQ5_9BACT|nr:peptide chain release factor H [Dysgonomonas macrotermitis]SHE78742.1 peptide chain release factor [Dysgonomonas macrotermitis]